MVSFSDLCLKKKILFYKSVYTKQSDKRKPIDSRVSIAPRAAAASCRTIESSANQLTTRNLGSAGLQQVSLKEDSHLLSMNSNTYD